jgi:hypothetical protein
MRGVSLCIYSFMYLLLMSLLWRKMHKDGGSLRSPILVHFRHKDPHRTRASPAKRAPDRRPHLHGTSRSIRLGHPVIRSFGYGYRKRVAPLPASLVPSYCPFYFGVSSRSGGCTRMNSARCARSVHRWCLSSAQKMDAPVGHRPLAGIICGEQRSV